LYIWELIKLISQLLEIIILPKLTYKDIFKINIIKI